eukprot:TRINITY_DN2042_c0_g1_i2.p1 TRINITY_DN2042_c0_g1~~TRINITY_DN2042_c0_g1_i2.p1  ORF type:complete len:323 (+),score=72.43 TRINITY_DN2042_c0_g1_i2:94-1062(+)
MNTILLSALSFSWLVFLFEGYLDLRQRKTFKKSDFPKELEGVVTIESVVKSRAYGLDKNTFGFITGTFGQVENTFILLLGGMPFLWYTSVDIVSRFGYSEANEIMVTCTFALLAMIYEMVVHLGFELYSTFVIEQRHGFNKQTLALFAADKLKAIGLSIVIGGPLLAVLITLIQWGGPHFYIYVWLFLVAFQLVMLLVYPTLIAPLFNKFEPLPDGELRSAIEALAKSYAPAAYALAAAASPLSMVSGRQRRSPALVTGTRLRPDQDEEEEFPVLAWLMWVMCADTHGRTGAHCAHKDHALCSVRAVVACVGSAACRWYCCC